MTLTSQMVSIFQPGTDATKAMEKRATMNTAVEKVQKLVSMVLQLRTMMYEAENSLKQSARGYYMMPKLTTSILPAPM